MAWIKSTPPVIPRAVEFIDFRPYIDKFPGDDAGVVELFLNTLTTYSFTSFLRVLQKSMTSFEELLPPTVARIAVHVQAESDATGAPPCKSSVWVMQLAIHLGLLSEATITKLVYVGPHPSASRGRKVDCIMVTDDMSYSGGQAANALATTCASGVPLLAVVIPFVTTTALDKITQRLKLCTRNDTQAFFAFTKRVQTTEERMRDILKDHGLADFVLHQLARILPAPRAMQNDAYYATRPLVVFAHKMADFISQHTSVLGAGLYFDAEGQAKSFGPLVKLPTNTDPSVWQRHLSALIHYRYNAVSDTDASLGIDVDVVPDIHPHISPMQLDNHYPRPPYKLGCESATTTA